MLKGASHPRDGRAGYETRSSVANALARLTAEDRAVIYRSYYLRWPVAQIAADLEISEARVTAQLHHGLRALRWAFYETGVKV
jgi:DNA-directed RNA polymerase specialized sigma24 family protein